MPRKKIIEGALPENQDPLVEEETLLTGDTPEPESVAKQPKCAAVESAASEENKDSFAPPESVPTTEETLEITAMQPDRESTKVDNFIPEYGSDEAFAAEEKSDDTLNMRALEARPEDAPVPTGDSSAEDTLQPAITSTVVTRARQIAEDERQAFYGLDFNELDRSLTPEQRQEWNSIYASYRGHSVMRGVIVGVDPYLMRVRDRKTGEMKMTRCFCASVIPFRVRVLIPESEMWAQGEDRPLYVMRNMSGATIDFVITYVDRVGELVAGSRRRALESRRYFFSSRSSLNAPGSRTQCHVLVVGPRRCLVTCHGFDVDLTQRELSYQAIPDLRAKYRSGQDLDCIIKAYDKENNRLSLSVKETIPNPYDGAALRHPPHAHRQAIISGKYGGGVFCNLVDGVTVMCNYSFQHSDSAFRIGDRVILIIQRYDDTKKQIYGKIVAKC